MIAHAVFHFRAAPDGGNRDCLLRVAGFREPSRARQDPPGGRHVRHGGPGQRPIPSNVNVSTSFPLSRPTSERGVTCHACAGGSIAIEKSFHADRGSLLLLLKGEGVLHQSTVPPTSVGDTRQDTPWTDFQCSVTPHQARFQHQTTRSRQAVVETFPTTPCSGPTPLLMWSNRALKIGPVRGVFSCVTYGSIGTRTALATRQ